MSVEIRPIGKKILFQIFDAPAEENRGGIIVAVKAERSGHRKAVVRRVGNFYRGPLEAGMEVMLKPWCGAEITVNRDERLIFATEDEVVCVVE